MRKAPDTIRFRGAKKGEYDEKKNDFGNSGRRACAGNVDGMRKHCARFRGGQIRKACRRMMLQRR